MRCIDCGREFAPRRAGHARCDRCYWQRRRLRQIHPRLGSAWDLWWVGLLGLLVWVVVELVARRPPT